jgi:hypothetical protein
MMESGEKASEPNVQPTAAPVSGKKPPPNQCALSRFFFPVKRGYVDKAEQWRYSSARSYAGEVGLVEIDRWW